jgi:NDP-sugar pyrophosphorylase family protein
VVEPELLDTAGAVRYAATEAGIDDTFLVFNGDVLSDLDVSSLVAFHQERGAEGTIALTPVRDPSAFGVVPTDDTGRVQAFIEKPAPGTAPTNMINAGAYVLERSVLDRIEPGVRVNIERVTFPAMVADGTLYALPSDGYWLDVGTPDRFLAATLDLLAGRRPGPPAPQAVELSPGVWQLGSPRVTGAVGPDTLVADGAVVAGAVSTSVVGPAATVATGAAVTGSVLMRGVSVETGAVVTDSIVGPGAVIGAGATVRATVVGVGARIAEHAAHNDDRVPA